MKLLVVISLFAMTITSVAAATATKKTLPVTKTKTVKTVVPESKEDCDAKAKKPIEIKPESISLTGNAGCSLDEVKH